MLSDLLDVLGLLALVAGVFILLGAGWCLLAGGGALMFTARAVEGEGDAAFLRVLTRLRVRARRMATAPMRLAKRARRKPQAA